MFQVLLSSMILWYSMISGHIMENPMENPIPRGPRFIWNTPHRHHGIWGTFWDQIPHVCPVCFSRMYDMDISRMRNDNWNTKHNWGLNWKNHPPEEVYLVYFYLWGLNWKNQPQKRRFIWFEAEPESPALLGCQDWLMRYDQQAEMAQNYSHSTPKKAEQ